MSITIGGKEYLSYEEQILKNKEDIENLKPKVLRNGDKLEYGKVYLFIPLRVTDEGYVDSCLSDNNNYTLPLDSGDGNELIKQPFIYEDTQIGTYLCSGNIVRFVNARYQLRFYEGEYECGLLELN